MAGLKLDFSAIRELGKAIAGTTETRQQTKKAIVREITDGGAVVEIAGSGVLTPVESSAATYSVGDVVTVSNRGGKLHIDGDVSAPSVGAGYVRKTVQPVVQAVAEAAQTAADGVKAGADAQKVADEAKAAAAATNQHFWTDSNGAHVTDDEQDAWNEEYAKDGHGSLDNPTAAKPWHNILMNSLGILLRTGLRNLVSITRTAVGFFDGRGNGAGNVVASFGREGAVLGHETSLHTEVTDEGFAIKDGAKTLVSIDSDSAQIGASDAEHTVVDSSGMSVYNADGTYAKVNSVDVVKVKEATDQAVADAVRAAEAAESAEQSASDAEASASQAAESAGNAAASAQSAEGSASQAVGSASSARSAASNAAASAQSASRSAESAANDARSASEDAARANTAANSALVQASIVEDVAGTLDWISRHGTYVATADTTVREGTVYFEKQGADYVPVAQPDGNPSERGWYTLDVTDSQSEYIMAHLAVTSAGLWVLPSGLGSASGPQHAAGYKMLLAADGSYLYDSAGVLVRSDTASGTDFASSRDWHVGGDEAYIFYDASEGTITVGGSSIQLGSTKTLSELVAEVDGTVVFKVTEEYSQDRATATLTAHVYKGGVDTASQYDDLCFAWYRKSEAAGEPLTPLPAPYTNGRVVQVARSTVGYGAAIVCRFEPPNDAGLLTGDDDSLTTQDGEPLTARTPSGDYVRVADLTVETVVFETDKVMLVGSEDEHLVSIATLKETFGDGDYERLSNKPSIEGVTLSGDKTFPDLGIFQRDQSGYDVPDDYTLSTMDINALWANSVAIGA